MRQSHRGHWRLLPVLASVAVAALLVATVAASGGSELQIVGGATRVSEHVRFLGSGQGIPVAIASAGLSSRAMAWPWHPGTSTSTFGSEGGGVTSCTSKTGHTGGGSTWCSTGSQSSQINCSTHIPYTLDGPVGPNCSAWQIGQDPNVKMCSASPVAGLMQRNCSVADSNPVSGPVNGDKCSAWSNGGGGQDYALCSVWNGTGSEPAFCSAEGGEPGDGTGNWCSADAVAGAGPSSAGCSALGTSGPTAQCSVVQGSGNSCTTAAGSAPGAATCSVAVGSTGQCSSRRPDGSFQPPQQPGNICQ